MSGDNEAVPTGTLNVSVDPHWVNAWFLRLFARPLVVVDSIEHAARWRQPVELSVAAGSRSVAVGARYRGFSSILGAQAVLVQVPADGVVALQARNGPWNHSPFRLTCRARDGKRVEIG